MDTVNVETQWFEDFKKELPKVEGKVFVITGTTSGTGYVAARTAAELGGEVLLLNRPSERATNSLASLKEEVSSGKFIPIDCDLQDFKSVRAATDTIKERYDSIYAVCWNAGVMACPDKATVDGYDVQMQTNHLSHFLLTVELYPLLEACAAKDPTANPRIVNHSSGGRHMTRNKILERQFLEKNGGNLGGDVETKGFGGPAFERYFHTKLANAVFTKALHQKLQAKSSKILAICADPGMSATSLGKDLNTENFDFKAMEAMMQTSEDGAMGIIKGMMDPTAVSGVHYGPATTKGPAVINEEKPYETNPESIAMLWATSEEATGVKFTI